MKELLLTISTKIKNTNDQYWKENWMFYKATINNNIISLGTMHLDETEVRAAAETAGISLATLLERGIASDSNLLQYCKLHRVGYDRTLFKNPVTQLPQSDKIIETHRWNKFIIKVLTEKEDTINLEKFLKTYNTTQYEPSKKPNSTRFTK